MQTSLASILLAAGLEGLSVKDAEPSQDFPGTAALEHSVNAAWNELFGLFADTPMERPAEDLAWNFVNIFHRAGEKQERKLDDLSDEIRTLVRERDQSEIGSANLETVIERARETEQVMASRLAEPISDWSRSRTSARISSLTSSSLRSCFSPAR